MTISAADPEEAYLAQEDHAIADAALDTIFRNARTMRHWQDKPVSPALLMAIYDLTRLGPTESNITPARFHFVVSKEAKARLEPLLDEGNRKQTMAAPATAIVAYDLDFRAHLAQAGAAQRRKSQRDAGQESGQGQLSGATQRRPAGRLFHCRGARPGPGLRPHVGLQQ